MSIPIYDPEPEIASLRLEIDRAIATVLDHGQFILGPEVKKFEEKAAAYLGVKHAIGVNSGTDALVIALRTLGIGEGDEVITTPMSFFATAESISMVGAKPVFADIDPATFNIDPGKIEEKITKRTKAILPVHLFGLPAGMSAIVKIARNHELKVIEDCAQSFGAAYRGDCLNCGGDRCDGAVRKELKGMKTGAIGDAGAFSFFPTKNLGGVGDGGLITTDNDTVAGEARMLRVHGASDKYHNEKLGYNSRLDTIQAAVLEIKLRHIDEFNKKRRGAAAFYGSELENISELITPAMNDGHVFHQYTVRIRNGSRDALKAYLKENGISSNIYFPLPQNELPVYKEKGYPELPVAHEIAGEVLSLPFWPRIARDIQARVTGEIKTFFSR